MESPKSDPLLLTPPPPEEKELTEEEWLELIQTDQQFRKELTNDSVYWFGHVYFAEFIQYETADFQREIYQNLQELADAVKNGDERRLMEILGFRNSAKSVIVTLIFVIWAMVTSHFNAKYIVLVGQTAKKATKYLANIKRELEKNELLIADWGPFKPEKHGEEDWQKTSIYIPRYGTRIESYTVNQDMRGVREGASRPDIVILDDPDSPKSARKKEQRDKLYDWVKSELMNVGELRTIFLMLGNLVHSDGFMARLRKEIKSGAMPGILMEIPIVDKDGNPMWPGKFPDKESLEREKRRINNRKAWARENELKIVPEEGQVVKEEWIIFADAPHKDFQLTARGSGVDLAISKKQEADFTSFVNGVAGTLHGNRKIYIGPHPINEHLSMFEMVERAKTLQKANLGMKFFVEVVAYQAAAIEALKRAWVNVDGVSPGGSDKRARLEVVAGYIQDGTIEFLPGCEDLIQQMLGMGIEEHDDLVDAFVYCILGLMKSSMTDTGVVWLG